jgi:hypothetical protein
VSNSSGIIDAGINGAEINNVCANKRWLIPKIWLKVDHHKWMTIFSFYSSWIKM